MQKFFRVKGRVEFAGGEPAAGVWLALVDQDLDYDDLLGVGIVNPQGEFRLTFTSEAFNQEAGEQEERPDLYVIASVKEDQRGLVPVLRRDFHGLPFEGEEDLGVIKLPQAKGAKPEWASGLRPAPGATKLVRRIRLDDELVALAAREVVPLVEELTGWSNLLADVKLELVEDFTEYEERRLAKHLGRERLTRAELAMAANRAEWCDVTAMGLWANRDRTIYLNRPILAAQNYDALKVVLAHELVHVGQSTNHADVDATITRFQTDVIAHAIAGTSHSREELNEITRFMANIEGHAMHVEEAILSVFTHGQSLLGAQLKARQRSAERRNASEFNAADIKDLSQKTWREILENGARGKEGQYETGRLAYRALAPDNGTARFDPSLRPELRFAEETVDLLMKVAEKGDANSQYELGVLYRDGTNGVTRDEEKAKVWFARAGENGFPAAIVAHAALLPKGPERLELLRGSAESGYAPAQHMYGVYVLDAGDVAGATWIEKAADQGSVPAMEALALIYEKGLGVPRDIVKGRIWKKRAATAAAKK